MIAPAKTTYSEKKSTPAWHQGFLEMAPAIERHAQAAFRYLRAEARGEMVQEVLCNCCRAYARLAELGKTDIAYTSVLARFGVAQARAGRKVGNRLNCRDVLHPYCQKVKKLTVERLDQYDATDKSWSEAVVEGKTAGPAEIAATRIDFSTWLELLPRRLRKLATFLANGETTSAASRRFHLTPGRISQLRGQLFQAWHRFQGDLPASGTA
jgi:hypothetical protein